MEPPEQWCGIVSTCRGASAKSRGRAEVANVPHHAATRHLRRAYAASGFAARRAARTRGRNRRSPRDPDRCV